MTVFSWTGKFIKLVEVVFICKIIKFGMHCLYSGGYYFFF